MALADGTTAPCVDWLQGGFYGDFEPEMKIRDGRCGESGALEGKDRMGLLASVRYGRIAKRVSQTKIYCIHRNFVYDDCP